MIKEYAIYRIYDEKSDRFLGKPWTRLAHVRLYATRWINNPDWLERMIVYDLNSIHGLSTYPVKDIMK